MVVHDGSGGIAVDVQGLDSLVLTRGSGVQVDGFLGFEGRAPVVLLPAVRRTPDQDMPPAVTVSVERILAGQEDHQWVEIIGRLKLGAMVDESQTSMEIEAGGRVLKGIAGIAIDGATLFRTERVRIRGVPIRDEAAVGDALSILPIERADDIAYADEGGEATEPRERSGFAAHPRTAASGKGGAFLRSVREVKSQDPAAARGAAVRLRGVVTSVLPLAGAVIVQDDTGAIFAHHGVFGRDDLSRGLLVDVEGVSAPGQYAPILEDARIKVLGEAPLPSPVSAFGMRSLLPEFENAYTEVRGVVQSVRRSSANDTLLIVVSPAGSVLVQAEGGARDADLEAFLDAEVVCRGVISPVHSRRQIVGVQVLTRLSDIDVTRLAPSDPLAAPAVALGDLRGFRSGAAILHRAHTSGTVTACFRDGRLFIADRGWFAAVQVLSFEKIPVGTVVDAAGFLEPGGGLLLTESFVRRRNDGAAVEATLASVGDLLSGRLDAALVRVEASLLGSEVRRGRLFLTMRASGRTFDVELEAPQGVGAAERIRLGSRLAVTGVCETDWDSRRLPPTVRGFHLRLRSPEDIEVVVAASWWTGGRILALVSALTLGAGIYLAFGRQQRESAGQPRA